MAKSGNDQTSMATENGSEQEPGGSQLAVPDDPQVGGENQVAVMEEWPRTLRIGTKSAFRNGDEFTYEKVEIDGETVYVCDKGSQHARPDEVLVLRLEMGTWTAYDTALVGVGQKTYQCRQAVFRCKNNNITKAGWYPWESNWCISKTGDGFAEEWHPGLEAETRVQA